MMHPHSVSALIARARGCVFLFLATVPLGVAAAFSIEPTPQSDGPLPSPELEPSEVVRIQVEALRKNSLSNKGIELTYRFASPDNKRYTGPLTRFTEMVRSAPYNRLLNHRSAQYSPMAISGSEAHQMVIVIDAEGEEIAYVWALSRQTEGVCKDCWMTDAVIPAERQVKRRLTQRLLILIETTLPSFDRRGGVSDTGQNYIETPVQLLRTNLSRQVNTPGLQDISRQVG